MAHLIENRLIRVFISSTFRDMQDERDELMKKTFPLLRRKAAERDVMLTELDLRWGITPEESESGKVVEICLREIENSVPFFIGIIGNRYGWVPSGKDLEESTLERFRQVPGYVDRQLSVTEMEMQFGVLERPEDMHAFFFIKEQESNDIDDPVKLAALKDAVQSNGRYPVSTYSSPEDLANQVEKAFTKLLDELYPEGALSELEKERIGKRAYLNSLCQNYIRTDANFRAIEDWMADWDKHQLVITGASGLGKSALVANWVKEKQIAGDGLPYRIIYHFVGNGGSIGSHGHIIKALCDEIRDRYGFNTDEKDEKTDEKELEELFNRVAAEGDKPLLIVLDAINQIIDIDHSKRLNWLPIPPKKVKILFTTLEDDETMEVFKDRHYPIFTLQPLSREQRKEMVAGYLSTFSKKLQPYQVKRIVDDPQCQNTLVLKTLLDELVNFGVYERLDMKIDTYLGTASVEDFYGILLKGYEADFGEAFVKHILSLIAVSRNGLSEEEILAITKETPLHWSQFFCAIRQHLIVKNGFISFAHSYIRKTVGDRYISNQTEWEYSCREEIINLLKGIKSNRAMEEIPYHYDIVGDNVLLYNSILDLECFKYYYNHHEIELGRYWQKLLQTGLFSIRDYWQKVEKCHDTNKAPIYLALSHFTRTTVEDPKLSLLFIKRGLDFVNDEKERLRVMNSICLSYESLGELKKALEFGQRVLEVRQTIYNSNHRDIVSSYNNLGSLYRQAGDYQRSLESLQAALERIPKNNRTDVFFWSDLKATIDNNIGLTYESLGNYQMALVYEKKALTIRRSLYGDDSSEVANSYNNLGNLFIRLNTYPTALEYEQMALDIRIRLFGNNHTQVANSFNGIGVVQGYLGNHAESLKNYKKALRIWRLILGENHPSVAAAYNNISVNYLEMGSYSDAREYCLKALEIRLSLFGEQHLDVASSFLALGHIDEKLKNYNNAIKNLQKGLVIVLSLFGEQHPSAAEAYNGLGLVYDGIGEWSKALANYERALAIRLSVFGKNNTDVATSYTNIGSVYEELGYREKALEYEQKALSIQLEVLDENHPDIARTYSHIGQVYVDLAQDKEALDYQLKALNIQLVTLGEFHPETAITYNNIGSSYGKLGFPAKELTFRKKALEIARTINDGNMIAILLNRVGKAYKATGQIESANDYFCEAAKKCRELGDEKQAQDNLSLIE